MKWSEYRQVNEANRTLSWFQNIFDELTVIPHITHGGLEEHLYFIRDVDTILDYLMTDKGVNRGVNHFSDDSSFLVGNIHYSPFKYIDGVDVYSIDYSIFDKGYGALGYLTVMSLIHPNAIISDRTGDISDDALKLWTRFNGELKSLVTRHEITHYDFRMSDEYDNGFTSDELEILDGYYTINQALKLDKAFNRGEDLLYELSDEQENTLYELINIISNEKFFSNV